MLSLVGRPFERADCGSAHIARHGRLLHHRCLPDPLSSARALRLGHFLV